MYTYISMNTDKTPIQPNTNELIKKLEKEGMEKTSELLNRKNIEDPGLMADQLVKIMSEGANEFKQKTGRNMTYSEMRAAYG